MIICRRIDVPRNREIICLLNGNNYIPGRKIGDGYNREVYEVTYKKDRLNKKMIAKIYKKEADIDSIQHKVNLTKGLKEKEIDVLNNLIHPNIVQVTDIITKDDLYITIEDYFDAISLEDRIDIYGPILNRELFRDIFSQVSNALRYLNIEKNILHRDIKPQNILLGRRDDVVKLSDFQNAAKIENVASKLLPTRGGTQFTHPRLLNSLINGKEDSSNIATEFYALGITMYRVLAGELPFDFRVKIDDDGQKIKINDITFGISLNDGGNPIDKIEIDSYERRLNDKIRRIPVRYRRLLWNCLSMKSDCYESMDPKVLHKIFEEDFKCATAERGRLSLDIKKLKPLVDKLSDDTEQVQSIIQESVERIMRVGKRTLKSDSDSSGYGSDAVSTSNNIETYLLKQGSLLEGDIELIVEDRNLNYTGGTWTVIWSEMYGREFRIINDGKQVFFARKTISYRSGCVLEPEDIHNNKLTPWEIKSIDGLESLIDKAMQIETVSMDALSLINYLQNNNPSSFDIYLCDPETYERLFDNNGIPSFKIAIYSISPEEPIKYQKLRFDKETALEALAMLSTKDFSNFSQAEKNLKSLNNDGVYAVREYVRSLGEESDEK